MGVTTLAPIARCAFLYLYWLFCRHSLRQLKRWLYAAMRLTSGDPFVAPASEQWAAEAQMGERVYSRYHHVGVQAKF
jgi:hypothetical protein